MSVQKKSIGLIGLGLVSSYSYTGLISSPYFELTCVCDINPMAYAFPLYAKYPYYSNYKQMITDCSPEYVVIAVDTANHYNIAKHLLENSINVIIDKPATSNLAEFSELLNLAAKKRLYLDVIFHWQHGEEMYFLKNNLDKYGKTQKIYSTVLDPYTDAKNQISLQRAHLCGTWLDSGVNILSMMSMFIDISHAELIYKKHIMDTAQKQPCFSEVVFLADGIELNLRVDWNTPHDFKKSVFITDKGILDIFHSQQAVFFNGKNVFIEDSYPRLQRHYYNYFTHFNAINNTKNIFDVHTLLFNADKATELFDN